MILGDFHFSLKTLSPNSITRTTEYSWQEAERIGDLPNLQNLGISSDKIEIEGVFYPKLNVRIFSNSFERATINSINNPLLQSATIVLQRALRAVGIDVAEDGVWGSQTQSGVIFSEPAKLQIAIKSEAAGYYRLFRYRKVDDKTRRREVIHLCRIGKDVRLLNPT